MPGQHFLVSDMVLSNWKRSTTFSCFSLNLYENFAENLLNINLFFMENLGDRHCYKVVQ